MSAVLIAVLLVICSVAVCSVIKRTAYGCCGSVSHEREDGSVSDKNPSHYPYRWTMLISGMKCNDCARKIECSLDRIDGVWARVDLKHGSAEILGKALIDDMTLRLGVENLGYQVSALVRNAGKDVLSCE